MVKLTAAIVRAMRASPLPSSHFAREYGVSAETIRRARAGETWSWLTSEETPDEAAAALTDEAVTESKRSFLERFGHLIQPEEEE